MFDFRSRDGGFRELRVRGTRPLRYGLALTIFLVALLLRWAALPAGSGFGFLTFYPAAVITMYLCGLAPGTMVVALSATAYYYLFSGPVPSWVPNEIGVVTTAVFLVSMVLIGLVVKELQDTAHTLRGTASLLKQREQQYRGLLDDQTEVICRFKADASIVYVNAAYCRMTGKSAEELIGRRWQAIVWHEDLADVELALTTLNPAHPVVDVEHRIAGKDGATAWWRFVNRAFFDGAGNLLEVQSVGRNIDERKRLNEKLRTSEARLRRLIDANRAVILQIDAESGRILDANDAAAAFYGWSRAQLQAMNIAQIRVADPDQVAAERAIAARGERNHFVFQHRLACGATSTVEVHSTPLPIGDRTLLVSIIHDISERIAQETKVQELLNEQRAILDSEVVGIIKLSDRKCVWANAAAGKLLGYNLEEIVGQSTRMLYPSDPAHFDFGQAAYGVIESGAVFQRDEQLVRRDGSRAWFSLSGSAVRGSKGDSIWVFADITARKAAEQALQVALAESQDLYNNAPIGYHSLAADGTILRINDTELAWLGYRREEIVGRMKIQDFLAPERVPLVPANLRQLAQTGRLDGLRTEMIRKDGSRMPVLVDATAMMDEQGRFVMSRTTVVDITERLKAEAAVRLESEKNRALLRNASDGIHIIDGERRIVEVSDSFCNMLGYARAELLAMRVDQWEALNTGAVLQDTIHRLFDGALHRFETVHRRKDGSTLDVEIQAERFVIDEQPFVFCSARDITARKRAESRLGYLVNHDPLTELPNRRLFYDRLSFGISRARRNAQSLTVMLLDLDDFKPINDHYGHEAGDAALKIVAQRLRCCVREMDTVARLGGDEFGIVLADMGQSGNASAFAAKIIAALREPLQLHDACTVHIGVSLGIATYPQCGSEIDRLMLRADEAVYQSKARGKNTYTIARPLAGDAAVCTDWFQLDTSLTLGNPLMNGQHRDLAEKLNQLNATIQVTGARDAMFREFDVLSVAIAAHFAAEEHLMDQSQSERYPSEETHRRAHRQILDHLPLLREKLADGGEYAVLHTFKEWFAPHIAEYDVPLARWLLTRRRTANAAAGRS